METFSQTPYMQEHKTNKITHIAATKIYPATNKHPTKHVESVKLINQNEKYSATKPLEFELETLSVTT